MNNLVLNWVKSTHSGNGGCVEVAAAGRVLVRDTKDRHGPVLTFTPETWRRFAAQVKAGPA
jgi:predicted secreted Zn-dependent protease